MTVVVACGGVGDGVVVGRGVGYGVNVVAVAAVVGVGRGVRHMVDVGRRVGVDRPRTDVGGAIRGMSTSSAVVDRSAVEDGRAIRPIDLALIGVAVRVAVEGIAVVCVAMRVAMRVAVVRVAAVRVAVVRGRVLYAIDLALLVAMMATVVDAAVMSAKLGVCPRRGEKDSGDCADNSNDSKNYSRHHFSPPDKKERSGGRGRSACEYACVRPPLASFRSFWFPEYRGGSCSSIL